MKLTKMLFERLVVGDKFTINGIEDKADILTCCVVKGYSSYGYGYVRCDITSLKYPKTDSLKSKLLDYDDILSRNPILISSSNIKVWKSESKIKVTRVEYDGKSSSTNYKSKIPLVLTAINLFILIFNIFMLIFFLIVLNL